MPDIHDQLAWEGRMVDHGVERYRVQQDRAVEGGRTDETSAGSRLLRSYILQVSDHIRAYLAGKHPNGRRRNQYAKLLNVIDTDKVALFSLKVIINTLYNPQKAQSVCASIGRHIEDELRFSKFNEEHKEYYDEIVRSWERKGTTNYRHKHRVLVVKSNTLGVEWEPWTQETLISVGALIVSLLMEVCDLVETVRIPTKKGRQADVYLAPSQECLDWVNNHNELSELISPDTMPCIIAPDDWTSWNNGGYYSPQLRKRVPLVKVRSTKAGKKQSRLLSEADLSTVMKSINALQRTGWQINPRVKEVMQQVWHKNLGVGMPRSQPYEMPVSPIPEHIKPSELPEDSELYASFLNWKSEAREFYSMEKERVSQNLAVSRVMRMATDMEKYDDFYYVYTCDFRGRVYSATSGLSPQGTDHGKAMLQFSEGKQLGPRGLYWLKVHGANKWGTDKCSRDEQVQWVEERHDTWIAVANDPIEHKHVWADADKPYQFLAFCMEYADAVVIGDKYVSHLPIALDGTCNGLQHFSAMLRDGVGGSAVNLTPADKPADIYQQVGDVCTRKLKGLRSLGGEEHAGATNWLDLFEQVWGEQHMKRALPKKPVMTLPYGSTQQACTETIFRWSTDNAPDFFDKNTQFRHALYLSPKLWASISEVVIAAREAMDWLQQAAAQLAKAGHPVHYTTPLNFPMYQSSFHYKTRQIETQIGGRLRMRIASMTDKLDSRKQRQGASPNFVHSIDATHMLMCIDRGVDAGIDSFACIHDDFGVHACDTDKWNHIIRECFVDLHQNTNVLQSFKDEHETRHDIELPDLPARGDLDITDVLRSPYFFG